MALNEITRPNLLNDAIISMFGESTVAAHAWLVESEARYLAAVRATYSEKFAYHTRVGTPSGVDSDYDDQVSELRVATGQRNQARRNFDALVSEDADLAASLAKARAAAEAKIAKAHAAVVAAEAVLSTVEAAEDAVRPAGTHSAMQIQMARDEATPKLRVGFGPNGGQ